MASNGTRLVTDGALGMTACGRELELRQAHTLHLIVKKAVDLSSPLSSSCAPGTAAGDFPGNTTDKVSSRVLEFCLISVICLILMHIGLL